MIAGVLELTPDELLSTTRAVRKRLDLERPVEREVLEECLRLAQQAPTGSYAQDWHFVVVTDPERSARRWPSSGGDGGERTWRAPAGRGAMPGMTARRPRRGLRTWSTTCTRCRCT